MKKVSIIVPIYNVEKYIGKCIKSIVNQTYKNLEIILVDDGSTDSSLSICKEYKKKDERIVLVHKKNTGVSDARNKGLELVTGDYLAFIDADDYVNDNYIEELLNSLLANKTSISQCGINIVLNGNIISQRNYDDYQVISNRKILIDLIKDNLLQNEVIWNKLYDKKIFDNLRFASGKLHEDDFINYLIYYDQKRISNVPLFLYNYRQEGDSIMSHFCKKRLDAIDGLEERIKFFSNKNEKELEKYAIDSYLRYLKNTYFKVKKYIDDNKDICNKIKTKYKYYCKSAKFNIRRIFFLYFPDVYYYIKLLIYKIKRQKI